MRKRAICFVSLLAVAAALQAVSLASRFCSVGYRRGHRMVELRDGTVGYYSNPGYKNFVWLDQARKEGLMITGAAKAPPGQYRLYRNNGRLMELYVRLRDISLPLVLPAAWLFWRWFQDWRRDRPGHCFACGYDLRGVPRGESGSVSCPECSAVDDCLPCPAIPPHPRNPHE
ncbi:MAG: hypothetical protein IT435_09425 [Phycisphaerales bacterium]|nr:hypothetical protein [Phycisphaerales bacterium]